MSIKEEGRVVDWKASAESVSYQEAVSWMENQANAIYNGQASETVWLLEHPSLYTAGTSAKAKHFLHRHHLPLFHSGRGGQHTYHGPGQRIAYVLLDLRQRGRDLHRFVFNLEEWLILSLQSFKISGKRNPQGIGVWVEMKNSGGIGKIASIGIRVRRWVSYHGISLNVNPRLEYFQGIVPCGLQDAAITSLYEEGATPSMSEIDGALRQTWPAVFPS